VNGAAAPTPSMSELPTIGEFVHYTNLGDADGKFPPEIQAALVTGHNLDGTLSLHVFYRTGQFDMPSVEYTAYGAGTRFARGKWTWLK
jgi:hypothetical protein